MEIDYGEVIKFNKELNALDIFTMEFIDVLNKCEIKYVLVSGYISILFGRSRASEDIDIIIEKLDFEKFKDLWNELQINFECLNTSKLDEAFKEYLSSDNPVSIRFSKKKEYIPNMEVKFAKTPLEVWALDNRKELDLNSKKIFISPIELQISFKLSLGQKGNEKDIEDAKYLYELLKKYLDLDVLHEFNRKLKIEHLFKEYLE